MAAKKDIAAGFALPAQPRRTEVDESTAARFVTGPRVVPSERPRRPRGERLVAYVAPEVAEQLRVHCVLARPRCTLSAAVNEALVAWLEAQGHK